MRAVAAGAGVAATALHRHRASKDHRVRAHVHGLAMLRLDGRFADDDAVFAGATGGRWSAA